MIEVTQAGQAGKTKLLLDMHRLRTSVFKDELKWDVSVDDKGLEVDEFDTPEAIYLLSVDNSENVVGSWRMLSTMGPTMIRDIWPQFLESLPMPEDEDIFEVSRFAVKLRDKNSKSLAEKQKVIGEMFCGLTELCIKSGIKEIYTLYDERIERVIKKIDCKPDKVSEKIQLGDFLCQIGMFKTDEKMLDRLRRATGINYSVIARIDLPPLIKKRLEKKG